MKNCRTRDQPVTTGVHDLLNVIAVHSAVDFDGETEPFVAPDLVQPPNLIQSVGNEFLAAKTRVHAHDEHEIYCVQNVFQHTDRCGGVEDYAGTRAQALNVTDGAVQMRGGFVVDGNLIGTGFDEDGREEIRTGDHEVDVEDQFGGLADGLHEGRTQSEVGDKMAVHHINVKHGGPTALYVGDVLAQAGKIRREDGGQNLKHRLKEDFNMDGRQVRQVLSSISYIPVMMVVLSRASLLAELTARFRGVAAWIGGDVMLDDYIIGAVSRISPEAPVPVLDVHTRKYVLGGAANVAASMAALGSEVQVTGFAALDEAGQTLRHLLGEAGIGTAALVDSGERYTICKTRIVAGRQQIVRIDHELKTDVPEELMGSAMASAATFGAQAGVLVLSDYAKGLLTEAFCAGVIAAGKRREVPIVVDPKGSDFRKYRGCTVITPNLAEAGRAAGMEIDSESSLIRAGEVLLELLPGTDILITRGADGMTLFHAGKTPVTVPTEARQVYDVTGAGDTVVAVLAAALGAGVTLLSAMRLANVAAGIVVDKPGTATVTLQEILNHDGFSGLAEELGQ